MHHIKYEYRYCPVCGSGLESRILKGNEPERLVCTECEFIFYLDPKLVACTLVEIDRSIVLLKRDIEPRKGRWVMPGGYVDRGESVEAAAIRETEEECGIIIRINEILGVYSHTGREGVVVAYLAEHVSGELIVGDETREVGLFRPEGIPWEGLAFPSTVSALEDYCKLKGKEIRNEDKTGND